MIDRINFFKYVYNLTPGLCEDITKRDKKKVGVWLS